MIWKSTVESRFGNRFFNTGSGVVARGLLSVLKRGLEGYVLRFFSLRFVGTLLRCGVSLSLSLFLLFFMTDPHQVVAPSFDGRRDSFLNYEKKVLI